MSHHLMDLRIRASEARRQAGRLEELARAARIGRAAGARSQRGEEWRVLERAAEAEARALQLEAAVVARSSAGSAGRRS